jgi:hypothetical protein
LELQILQERSTIVSWREQISDSDYPAESAARLPPIVAVCLHIRSWANDDDSEGDGVGDDDPSTRST